MQSYQVQRKEGGTLGSKKSILFANNNLTYIQIGELQKNINELVQQNKNKYAKILQSKVDFKYQLYKIGEFQAHSKAFGKQLLLRQMDRLLEQKNYLDRQLSLIRFHDQEQTNEKEMMVSSETQHFQLLKSIWKKDGNRKYEGTVDHIESLNLMVGQIKCNIQSLIKFQSNDRKDFEDTYLNTCKILQQKNRECSKCSEMMAKNDYLKEKLNSVEDQLSKINDQNIMYLQEINSRDDKIKKLTKGQIKQETQLKDKIIRLQQEILKKDQSIKQFKRQIAEYNENKFVNPTQGFQLIFKGTHLQLQKFQKKINVTSEALLGFITQELHQELRITQVNQRNSAKSKCDSTQGSNKSFKEVKEQAPSIQTIQNARINHEEVEKVKEKEKLEHKNKPQSSQTVVKRYVRTSAKRAGRSNSIMKNEETAEGFFSVKSRGGSPSYGTNTE